MHRISLLDAPTKFSSRPGPFAFHHVIESVAGVGLCFVDSCPSTYAVVSEGRLCYSHFNAVVLVIYWKIEQFYYLDDESVEVEA